MALDIATALSLATSTLLTEASRYIQWALLRCKIEEKSKVVKLFAVEQGFSRVRFPGKLHQFIFFACKKFL